MTNKRHLKSLVVSPVKRIATILFLIIGGPAALTFSYFLYEHYFLNQTIELVPDVSMVLVTILILLFVFTYLSVLLLIVLKTIRQRKYRAAIAQEHRTQQAKEDLLYTEKIPSPTRKERIYYAAFTVLLLLVFYIIKSFYFSDPDVVIKANVIFYIVVAASAILLHDLYTMDKNSAAEKRVKRFIYGSRPTK